MEALVYLQTLLVLPENAVSHWRRQQCSYRAASPPVVFGYKFRLASLWKWIYSVVQTGPRQHGLSRRKMSSSHCCCCCCIFCNSLLCVFLD